MCVQMLSRFVHRAQTMVLIPKLLEDSSQQCLVSINDDRDVRLFDNTYDLYEYIDVLSQTNPELMGRHHMLSNIFISQIRFGLFEGPAGSVIDKTGSKIFVKRDATAKEIWDIFKQTCPPSVTIATLWNTILAHTNAYSARQRSIDYKQLAYPRRSEFEIGSELVSDILARPSLDAECKWECMVVDSIPTNMRECLSLVFQYVASHYIFGQHTTIKLVNNQTAADIHPFRALKRYADGLEESGRFEKRQRRAEIFSSISVVTSSSS